MSESNGLPYKYCMVPCCTNTTVKTPGKRFFCVPKNELNRKKWCQAMERDETKNKKLSSKTALYCCEDHFDLENDMENYWECRLTGNAKQHRLKSGVLPHIFDCQKGTSELEGGCARKRKVFDTRDPVLSHSDIFTNELVTKLLNPPPVVVTRNYGVQVCIRHPFRSKGVNASVPMRSTSTSMKVSPAELEKDVENYMQYKLQGGKLFLRKDIVPHKFECQKTFVPRKFPERKKRKPRKLTTSVEEDDTNSADEPREEQNIETKDFDVSYRSTDCNNEDMILPDVENRVSYPTEWSKRSASPEGFPSLKMIKQEVPDESSSGLDFYDYSKPGSCEASLSIDSEDQFDKFGKHIACQLRELPLRNALVLQETIQSLITKERIACLPTDSESK